MEQKQIAKQMIEFNKTAFDNSFAAMAALQDQTEKLVMSFLDKAVWFPEEGKKTISDWVQSYKKGRDDFKSAADDSFRKVTEYFAREETPTTTASRKKQKN
jgi:polyhydroxyalkanoate synthesis regulator phasin